MLLCEKQFLCGIVADAGQMFESIDGSQVKHAGSQIFRLAAEKSNQTTITVLTGQKRRAYAGGSCVFRSTRSQTFSHAELLSTLEAFTMMSLTSVGSMTARMSGVPIGGFLSKVCTSTVLNWAEHCWVQQFESHHRPEALQGLKPYKL